MTTHQEFRVGAELIHERRCFARKSPPPRQHSGDPPWIQTDGNERVWFVVGSGISPLRHRSLARRSQVSRERLWVSFARADERLFDDLVRWSPWQHRVSKCVTVGDKDQSIEEFHMINLPGIIVVIPIDERHRDPCAGCHRQPCVSQQERVFLAACVVNVGRITVENQGIDSMEQRRERLGSTGWSAARHFCHAEVDVGENQRGQHGLAIEGEFR